jgi:chromosome partitioning protein
VKESSVYKEKLITVFAINREIVNTAIGRDATEALESSMFPVLKTHVCQRVAFPECVARGLTVFETNTDRKAISEMNTLTSEILEAGGNGS